MIRCDLVGDIPYGFREDKGRGPHGESGHGVQDSNSGICSRVSGKLNRVRPNSSYHDCEFLRRVSVSNTDLVNYFLRYLFLGLYGSAKGASASPKLTRDSSSCYSKCGMFRRLLYGYVVGSRTLSSKASSLRV